jgi:hypothetical protein|tara:strand:- start:3647 stop:5563 length:1917 start_codon:yes stop_codon:yes gene_type:complete
MGKAIIEYAGYRAPRTTNWDKVLGEVGEDITGVVTKREKQREEDFNIQQETESAINDFTTGVSQDFSDYVSRGVEANRDLMMKYTKMLRSNQINSTQYKRLMNRVNSDWQQFGQFSKDFEKRLSDMETRRKNGDSSVIETWNGERIASAADFKNKQLVPNASSGGLYSVSYDENGKPKKTEIIHMNELNNFRGQLVDKVNLQKQIKNITDKAGDFKLAVGEAPIKSIEGISRRIAEADPSGRMLTEYNNLIDGIYNSVLTGPPNRVASALADNSLNSKGQEFFIYKEGDLAKGGKFEGRDAEDGIKMVQETDGSWGGELTEKQRELLKKKSKEIADVQLGFKEAYMAEDLSKRRLELDEAKFKEQKRAAKAKEARLAAADDDKETIKVKPYTQLLESFEAKDASRIRSNPKVDDAFYSKNGDELVVTLKGTDKTPGTTKTISTTDKEGQKAIARLMNPDLKESKIDELFDADYDTYKEEDRKSVPRDEVVVLEETDFKQKVKVGDKERTYDFDKFITDDWGDTGPEKVQYVKEVALASGILDLKDIDNLNIEVVDKGPGVIPLTRDDDFMKITYTMPDGRVIESDTLDNDPVPGQGKTLKENQKMFENFLQELRKEIYFKGESDEDETNSGTPSVNMG